MNWLWQFRRIMRDMGRVPSGSWRADNPHSIIDQFDEWFEFECIIAGFRDEL